MKKTIPTLLLCAALSFPCAPVLAGEVHEAAKSGDIAKLKTLLDADPGLLYVQDEQGKTPLHWATGRGQPEAMKLLLDVYRVDVDVRNKNGGTPLHVAASQAQPDCARILIAHRATIDARTKNGSTPLHFASFKGRKPGHIETARILLEHKANPDARTDNGMTPLGMAMARQNTEIIQLLRQYGAKDNGRQMGMGRMGQGGMMDLQD